MDETIIQQQAEQRNAKNAFAEYNHLELESVEPDHAVFRLLIRPESKNPYGIVHGSAIYTMADGRIYVTQDSAMHFLRNQTEGIVRADAHVLHRGKSTCLVHVDIFGEDGRLLATGTFTYFCVDPAIMAQKAAGHR